MPPTLERELASAPTWTAMQKTTMAELNCTDGDLDQMVERSLSM
jgi:hypothetical protein